MIQMMERVTKKRQENTDTKKDAEEPSEPYVPEGFEGNPFSED